MRKPVTPGDSGARSEPIRIRDQGSFVIGGSVIQHPGRFDPLKRTPDGQTLHGDHAYVQYQIPSHASHIPLVFLHGAGQFSRCWGSTPDGREGFQSIFLRRGFPVPHAELRGNARSVRGAPAGFPAVDNDPDRSLLQRQHPGTALSQPGHGQLACLSCNGTTLGGNGKLVGRSGPSCSPARYRHLRQRGEGNRRTDTLFY